MTKTCYKALYICICAPMHMRLHVGPWLTHIDKSQEAQSPSCRIPDAYKDRSSRSYTFYTAWGMCRTYTNAPPITLTCKYVICSSDSRYTWLHSVTSTDVESLPTGSLLLEGEASSLLCKMSIAALLMHNKCPFIRASSRRTAEINRASL